MKECTIYNQKKELIEFSKHILHKDGLYSQCKLCRSAHRRTSVMVKAQREQAKKWRIKNPDKVKKYRKEFYQSEHGQRAVVNWNLKTTYGITFEQYNKKFQDQDGKCAICKAHQSILKRRLAVDHNHKTGKIRSLLCHGCNTALGLFCENINLLKSAINYLEINNQQEDLICLFQQ